MKNIAIAAALAATAACAQGRSSVAADAPAKTIVVPAGEDRAYDDWHYAPAIRAGDLLIVSGLPAARGDTYEAKVRSMFERLKRTLAAAGADLSDVVELQGYPAWTAVGTTALLAPGAVLEMRVVAIAGSGKHTEVRRAPK